MRTLITRSFGKLAVFALALIVVAAFAAQPALAFDNGDGRYAPENGERLAVYVRDGGVEIWGIDGNLNGVYLATFSAADVASGKTLSITTETGGVVTLRQTKAAIVAPQYDESGAVVGHSVTESAEYVVSWVDATFGANGEGVFSKAFAATYLQ